VEAVVVEDITNLVAVVLEAVTEGVTVMVEHFKGCSGGGGGL
jgi:phenylpyruvate tautomerase PptA (4-oxalocrotonate tautomerase family)